MRKQCEAEKKKEPANSRHFSQLCINEFCVFIQSVSRSVCISSPLNLFCHSARRPRDTVPHRQSGNYAAAIKRLCRKKNGSSLSANKTRSQAPVYKKSERQFAPCFGRDAKLSRVQQTRARNCIISGRNRPATCPKSHDFPHFHNNGRRLVLIFRDQTCANNNTLHFSAINCAATKIEKELLAIHAAAGLYLMFLLICTSNICNLYGKNKPFFRPYKFCFLESS